MKQLKLARISGKWSLFAFCIGLFSLSSCHNLITGAGDLGEANTSFSANTIQEVELNDDFKVYLGRDTISRVKVTGYQNIIDHIHPLLDGNKIIIESDEGYVFQNSNVVVYVYTNSYSKIKLNSSGEIQSLDSIVTNTLEVTNNGSGSISLFGDVNILNGYSAGSGSTRLCAMSADTVNAFMIGSGTLSVWPVSQLNAQVTGSGQIQYLGSPGLNFNISGTGSLLQTLGCY